MTHDVYQNIYHSKQLYLIAPRRCARKELLFLCFIAWWRFIWCGHCKTSHTTNLTQTVITHTHYESYTRQVMYWRTKRIPTNYHAL